MCVCVGPLRACACVRACMCVLLCGCVCVRMHDVRVHARACVCMRVYVRACVRACGCARAGMWCIFPFSESLQRAALLLRI